MKARFNYDLTEVKELLQIARAANHKSVSEPSPGAVSIDPREMLIERAEELTRLMNQEVQKSRSAFSNINYFRATELLKPQ